ncbi:MlaC/ttg2D family ABC transporter substrate-binding protein [Rhodopila sp.]|uniref:MlaC/ttg2D family ABC transporter substrate-binding protein n=1 Tax=Rhodopila sp. TaxID=2480087 RepID=UPI003D0A0790
MIQRRTFLTWLVALCATGSMPLAARAQSTDRASSFVKATGDKLVAVVNGPGSAAQKRGEMTQIINASVDVDSVGRFCLGRYWRQASEEQKKRYLDLFHEVLITNITSKLGDYKGVKFTLGRSRPQDEEVAVSTTVDRPNNPPTAVDWIISNPDSAPKIIDVVAEGTSLRLTQRSDYASYLAHNNNNINALITAMHRQVEQNASG